MSVFKKGPEVIDLTILQKRGLLKKVKQEPNLNHDAEGYADLTKQSSLPTQPTNQFDFLDSLANASSSTPTHSSEFSNTDIRHLNVKLDDLEYKLERMLERITELEMKMKNRDN